jgi:hypothetical protein
MQVRRTLLWLLALLAPIIASCASGSAIVTGNVRPAIPAHQVRIYLEPPAAFEVIALVSASSDAGWTAQGSVDYAVAELKSQAARLGANGVLLVFSGDRTTSVLSTLPGGTIYSIPVTAKTLQGKAIFIPRQ